MAKEKPTVLMTDNQNPNKQMATREYHDRGEKTVVFIPIIDPKHEEKHMIVSINDVQWIVEKGKQVEVPVEVGRIIHDRLMSEGLLARGQDYVTINRTTGGSGQAVMPK